MSAPARFGWHADSYDSSLASVRYRLLMPLAALQAQDVPIERLNPTRDPASYDAVIFSKSHSAAAVAAARALRAAGKAVVFDLCDNLYAAHAVRHVSDARLARFQAMLDCATHLTFSTAMLAEQIGPVSDKPRRVIPDTLDIPVAAGPAPSRSGARQLARVDRFLGKHSDALHAIWFGKSLGSVSGFAHLHAAAARLAAQPFPITLTVVSNARLRWWLGRWRWRLPVHYVGWRQETAAAVLARHRVAVIPVAANDYTVGKTINRPATAILSGLGVVADAIPSYEELRPFVALDDWDGGLALYRHYWPEEQARLAQGRSWLAERYSADAVARQWSDLLAAISSS